MAYEKNLLIATLKKQALLNKRTESPKKDRINHTWTVQSHSWKTQPWRTQMELHLNTMDFSNMLFCLKMYMCSLLHKAFRWLLIIFQWRKIIFKGSCHFLKISFSFDISFFFSLKIWLIILLGRMHLIFC